MNILSFLRVALVLGLALPFVAHADQPTPTAEPPPERALITLDFPGGPLSKLAAKLNEGGASQLSIVQTAGLDPMLPAFSVHNVHVPELIAALGQIVEPQGYALMPIGSNLAVLSRRGGGHRGDAFQSLQLEPKLGNRSVEDVIAAIQMGCEFANPEGKASTLRFKYHPGTKLLFVAGTEREVEIAYQVYASLPSSPPKQPAPPVAEKK